VYGATVISNSWGGGESSGETGNDVHYNHPGVPTTFSSGDSGYGVEYPAASQYVTAVGGTTLKTANNTRGWTETAWSGAGTPLHLPSPDLKCHHVSNFSCHSHCTTLLPASTIGLEVGQSTRQLFQLHGKKCPKSLCLAGVLCELVRAVAPPESGTVS
jgi:hypothetical protein